MHSKITKELKLLYIKKVESLQFLKELKINHPELFDKDFIYQLLISELGEFKEIPDELQDNLKQINCIMRKVERTAH